MCYRVREEVSNSRAEGFIEKPIEIDKVIAAVSKVIAQLDKEHENTKADSNKQKNVLPLMQRGMLADLLDENFMWEKFVVKSQV